MNHALVISIQKTIAYFDQFSHPLTARELFTFLWEMPSLTMAEFLKQLPLLVKAGVIGHKNGYYFLPNRVDLVARRAENFLIQEKKLSTAHSALRWLALVPFVRGIFICNTVAAGWPTPSSDVDLFIIIKSGRLWFTRWLFTVMATALNRRRHGAAIADHLCLSFYITDRDLSLESVRITKPDIYLTYWLQQLIPVYAKDTLYQELLSANSWTAQYLHQAEPKPSFQKMIVLTGIWQRCKQALEFCFQGRLGNFLEKKFRHYQLVRINRRQKSVSPYVVVNDGMLKFHEADRREQYQAEWYRLCERLSIL